MRDGVLAGTGLVVVGVCVPAAFALEAFTRPPGTDGDNAAESLLYLRDHGVAYQLSGALLLVAAIGLIRAATAVPWRTTFQTVVGSVAAGLWAFAGALRISAPGPIDHIGGYDEDWGEAAYLVVQMAGTQGGLLGGVMLQALWIVAGCLVAWRTARLPRPLCVLGFVALVYPLASAFSTLGEITSVTWILGIASLVVAIPLWLLASGMWLIAGSERKHGPADRS